ncbi:disulfide bond formation protein DsbA [Streptomyces sp. CB02923]|uniref:DsbA family oxidoreductase n=1 Tax=Streptomyces sp. CB02923 TaxID=1718985 RepID=UPI000938DC5F|nr:DsbA family oxidoreductase [Streptomyces sp. CB02923]OKI07321.1 disulfide bond formation protein DsbA [Streptomyces sp. CB02923]
MRVEIFFDVLCPWCFIGKRRLDGVLAGRDDVEVVWRSRELAPDGDPEPGPTAAETIMMYQGDAAKGAARVARIQDAGAAEGLELALHKARPVNTFDAHRLVHLGADAGLADAVVERFLYGYHTEGRNIADPRCLVTLATEAGLDADRVRDVLRGDAYAARVRDDEERGAQLGVTGVPSLVIDGAPPVSGVQAPEELARLLDRATRA